MKILRVIASMDPKNGGPCQGIRNSIPAQEKIGVQNEVLCFDAPNSSFLYEDNLKIHAIGPSIGPYAYCSRLKRWMEDNLLRFDFVIIHGVWLYTSFGSYYFWQEYKRKNLTAPKLFLMPHGMLDPYFQRAKGRKLKALRNLVFWQLVEKRVINGTDGLLFTCEEELKLARKNFNPYRPKSELNIGYGIQPPPALEERSSQEFASRCPNLNRSTYWLFLSRIHPKKGVELLLRAYLKLKKEMKVIPDLVIAGPGLHTSYGRSMQKLGAGSNIHFPGMLEGPSKWGAFHGCQAFILPSHQENFGIAVVEALACSKPVLISDQVNIWREIKNGNGGLVSKDTQEGINSMLEHWISLPLAEQNQMGHNCFKIYQSNYTINKAASRMVESLKEVKSVRV